MVGILGFDFALLNTEESIGKNGQGSGENKSSWCSICWKYTIESAFSLVLNYFHAPIFYTCKIHLEFFLNA